MHKHRRITHRNWAVVKLGVKSRVFMLEFLDLGGSFLDFRSKRLLVSIEFECAGVLREVFVARFEHSVESQLFEIFLFYVLLHTSPHSWLPHWRHLSVEIWKQLLERGARRE